MLKLRKGWITSHVGSPLWRRVVVAFAKEHKLVYFRNIDHGKETTPVIRGSTSSPKQIDTNICVGTHADYDITLADRISETHFEGYETSLHRWYVLQIDLKRANNLPFIFVGTKQQTKAYYAGLLTSKRQLHHLMLETDAEKHSSFHGHYVVLSSPANSRLISELFDQDMVNAMGEHLYPFSVEIENDSIIVSTEAHKPSQQLLNKLLHYGLWFAKEIDKKLN